MKFDRETKRELGYVTLGTLLLAAVEIGVFFAVGKYTADVLYGAILSAAAGILSAFLLAVTVTRAMSYPPEEEAAAKNLLKLSLISRRLFLLAVLAAGVLLFNWISTLVTSVFPYVIFHIRKPVVMREAAASGIGAEETEELAEADGEESETKGSEEDGTDEN